MSITWATAAWFLPFVLPITVWVSWSDMARMKIPNKAVLSLMAVFVVIGPLALPLEDYLWRYAHFAVVIVVGFILSTAGAVGAGDAKYSAAMAPFIAREDAVVFLFLLAATTVAAFVLHRGARRMEGVRARVPDWESWERTDFPMGFALAPALAFYLLIGLFSG